MSDFFKGISVCHVCSEKVGCAARQVKILKRLDNVAIVTLRGFLIFLRRRSMQAAFVIKDGKQRYPKLSCEKVLNLNYPLECLFS